MKRIFLGLFTIGVTAAIAVGVTRAYFTDTQTNTGNTFTAGTLVVNLDGEDSDGEPVNSPFFDVSDMVPGGATSSAYLEVRNDGSMDMLFRSYALRDNDPNIDSEQMSDQLNVKVTLNPSGYDAPEGYTAYGPADSLITDPEGDGWIPLSSLIGEGNALNNVDAAFDDVPLQPGFVAIYRIEVRLPFDTPDEWQNRNFTGDLVVDATQFDGQTEGDVQW